MRAPAGLRSIILKCLQHDPYDRYQTASELLRALEQYRQSRLHNARVRNVLMVAASACLTAALTANVWIGQLSSGWQQDLGKLYSPDKAVSRAVIDKMK